MLLVFFLVLGIVIFASLVYYAERIQVMLKRPIHPGHAIECVKKPPVADKEPFCRCDQCTEGAIISCVGI